MGATAVRYGYREVLDFYFDDIFGIILGALKPFLSSYEFLRRKHAGWKFRKILEMRHLSEEEKNALIEEFITCLPEDPTYRAYLESYSKILGVFERRFRDVLPLLEEISRILTPQEQEKIVRMQVFKSRGVIESLRESLSEAILDTEEPEQAMLIDQALALASMLVDEALKEKSPERQGEYMLGVLILLLRVEGIRRGVQSPEKLYNDVAVISGKLRKVESFEVPEGLAALLTSA